MMNHVHLQVAMDVDGLVNRDPLFTLKNEFPTFFSDDRLNLTYHCDS